MMTLRFQRIRLRLVLHGLVAGVALLGMVSAQLSRNPGSTAFFGLALLGYLVTLRVNPLPRLLERALLRETWCASCGQVTDLVNNWTCGCGFLTWEPRHGLAPCAHCRRVYDWLQCPNCEASIPT